MCIGQALTIKQSALALFAAIVLDRMIQAIAERSCRSYLVEFLALGCGVAAVWLPLMVMLYQWGWLGVHFHHLASLSDKHLTMMSLRMPGAHDVAPMAPVIWWVVLGVLCIFFSGRTIKTDIERTNREHRPRQPLTILTEHGATTRFLVLWFSLEFIVLWSLVIHSTHYCQPIVPSAVLLSGAGISLVLDRLSAMTVRSRVMLWRWIITTTAAFALFASLPMLAESSKRIRLIDLQQEEVLFDEHLKAWSPENIVKQWKDR